MCEATSPLGAGTRGLSASSMLLYYILRASWYWILACPVVSQIFSGYLFVSCGYFGMHWNEGFSSLQHTGFKNFVRLHVRPDGDLELFAIGLERSPKQWVVDGNHVREAVVSTDTRTSEEVWANPPYTWSNPSRWKAKTSRWKEELKRLRRSAIGRRPSRSSEKIGGRPEETPELDAKIVDHTTIKGSVEAAAKPRLMTRLGSFIF
mmetsp:Transcript_32621/g.95959  ORF Transcript_32621/g.95959 Transcript_32621/m.95959 type:complete len:206 (-) Transcript_32621:208-825(-)